MPTRDELMADPVFKAASKETQDAIVAKYGADAPAAATPEAAPAAAPSANRHPLSTAGKVVSATGFHTVGGAMQTMGEGLATIADFILPEAVSSPLLRGERPSGSAVGLATGLVASAIPGSRLPGIASRDWNLPAPIKRIVLGTVGATIGNVAETGEAPTVGGVAGTAGGLAAGEVVGRGVQSVRERLPGAAQRAGQQMAEQVGGIVDRAAPSLGPATTPGALQQIGQAPATMKASLGRTMDSAIDHIRGIIGNQTLNVPALAGPAAPPTLASLPLGGAPTRAATALAPQVQSRFTIDEAANAIKELRLRAFPMRGEGQSLRRADIPIQHLLEDKQRYRDAVQQVESELGSWVGPAASLFRESRQEFAAGLGIIDTLRRQGIFEATPKGVEMSTRGLQDAVKQNQDRLQRVLAPDEWRALTNVVFRGAGIGGGADLAKTGKFKDLPKELLQRQYVGRSPFATSEMAQILLDAQVDRTLGSTSR